MIQKIEKEENFTHWWIGDVKRIQQVLLDNNYSSTLNDCANLWEDYSDSMCAGWLHLPQDDEELFEILERLI